MEVVYLNVQDYSRVAACCSIKSLKAKSANAMIHDVQQSPGCSPDGWHVERSKGSGSSSTSTGHHSGGCPGPGLGLRLLQLSFHLKIFLQHAHIHMSILQQDQDLE